MIGQYLPNKTKVVLFIGLKFFHSLNVAPPSLGLFLKKKSISRVPTILLYKVLAHLRLSHWPAASSPLRPFPSPEASSFSVLPFDLRHGWRQPVRAGAELRCQRVPRRGPRQQVSTPPLSPPLFPTLSPRSVYPRLAASREYDIDVCLIRFDAIRCASSSGRWEDWFFRSVPNGLVPLKLQNPVVSWAGSIVCLRIFPMNRGTARLLHTWFC
jgi:hypothetical protein